MPDPESQITVADHPGRHRYEIEVDGARAGFASYRSQPGTVVFLHTEIDPAYEGRGLGGRLARAALDDVRAKGLTTTPLCPFIAHYIETHQEYADLVA